MNDDRRPEILWLDKSRNREPNNDIHFLGPVQSRNLVTSQSFPEKMRLKKHSSGRLCLACCALFAGLMLAAAIAWMSNGKLFANNSDRPNVGSSPVEVEWITPEDEA